MKKIIAVVLLLVIAVTCTACSPNKTVKVSETKVYNYTIINETGKAVDKVFLADDNSSYKAEVEYDKGMENGAKASISVSAVPDKDGNPSLTASYTIDNTEYMTKVTIPAAEIRLTPEGTESGAFDITAPQNEAADSPNE